MDYSEAVAVLEKAKEKFEFPVKWGIDLQSEHERYLTEKHAKKPVIVMNYPKDIKAFYMRLNDDGKTVAAMDVLAPGIGEIIGGSQREERLDVLDARMDECHIDKEHYAWYRDLRRYGTVPHAGFGLGFERTLAYVTGLANVRDAIPYPRTPDTPSTDTQVLTREVLMRARRHDVAGRAPGQGAHATRGSASVAISSPQIACARRFGWKPSHENRSGSNMGIRSTTRRGSRSGKRSAAACSTADRQPRMLRSGHGSAGKHCRGATPATMTAASPTRLRAAVTSPARSRANVVGER